MSEDKLFASARNASPFANVIDLQGELSSFSEQRLFEAYEQATQGNIRKIIINFTGLNFINSLGMGMLVTLLIRSRREKRIVVGYGLSNHYRNILAITRLDQVILIYASEETALAAVEPMDLPEREA